MTENSLHIQISDSPFATGGIVFSRYMRNMDGSKYLPEVHKVFRSRNDRLVTVDGVQNNNGQLIPMPPVSLQNMSLKEVVEMIGGIINAGATVVRFWVEHNASWAVPN